MKPLKLLKLEARNRGRGLLEAEPRKGYFADVYRATAAIVRPLIETMANVHSVEDAQVVRDVFRSHMGDQGELHELSDNEFLKLCEQVRSLWRDLAENAGKEYRPPKHKVLEEWWKHYPLSDSKRWIISYPTRTFFPRESNFRAFIATIIFENRTHMKTCSNCSRFFFGRRHDSKYCTAPECQRAYGSVRQEKHQTDKSKRAN